MDTIEDELEDFVERHSEDAKGNRHLAELLDHVVFLLHYWVWRRGAYSDADLVRNLKYRRPWHEESR